MRHLPSTDKMRTLVVTLLLSLAVLGSLANAATLDEAKKLVDRGDYDAALPILRQQVKKSPSNGNANYLLGVCLYQTGDAHGAVKYLETATKKRVAEAYNYLALIHYAQYDFDLAIEDIDQWESELKAKKKSLPDQAKALRSRVITAQSMFDHVEKIVVVDSITVSRDAFFLAYKLAPSAGFLIEPQDVPQQVNPQQTDMVYTTEQRNRMVWASDTRLWQAQRLLDGSWDDPEDLGDVLALGDSVGYPFLMQDGLTLYYAIDSESTMGGYDLYMSRRDTESGLWLGPQNLGMPYNSPYDDYMLAIDEENNLGWWATDRNQIADSVTIYVYIPNATRLNCDNSDPNLKQKAIMENWRQTWGEADFTAQQAVARAEKAVAEVTDEEFSFAISNTAVYHSLGDFKTREGKNLMQKLLSQQRQQAEREARLTTLRQQWAQAPQSRKEKIGQQILSLEAEMEQGRNDIRWTSNSIIKIETSAASN